MQGSLALSRGTLFVGLHAKTARILSFDLGGRPLGTAFTFRDERVGRSAAAGLALDADHRLWVADTPADRVRIFTLFGKEVGGLGGALAREGDRPALPGLVNRPVDVEVQGSSDGGWAAVACGGEQRHGVQLYEPDGSFRSTCMALGERERDFRGVCRLAARGHDLYVAESIACTVQVFRAGVFHFAFRLGARGGGSYEPSALAALDDGRILVGCRAPESALFLVDGAGRVQRRLAGEGAEEGALLEPTDVVVEAGVDDRHARVFVVDRDGLRVQAFTLEGRSLGAIALDGAAAHDRKTRGKKGGR